MTRPVTRLAAIGAAVFVSVSIAAQSVIKETVPGIVNFAKVESTVACAGATSAAALADVKKQGFASVLNLRMATEQGADIDAAAAAAKALGLTYIHLPMNTASPDPALVDGFLKAVTEKKNQPVFIHCASANRAAALWMIKRLVVDKWDADKAGTEAAALGLTNPALKTFALEQAARRK
ncbi:MAG: sulfur transferase domain-containing protein [Vicinamibacterales bacterium]